MTYMKAKQPIYVKTYNTYMMNKSYIIYICHTHDAYMLSHIWRIYVSQGIIGIAPETWVGVFFLNTV